MFRDKYAAEHRFSELCFERGLLVPTEEIHHKLPVSEGGTHDRPRCACHVIQPYTRREGATGGIVAGRGGEISIRKASRERSGGYACKIAK